MTKKQKKMLTRIIICAVMLVALQFLSITGIPRFILYLAAYLVIGYDILKKAGKGILNGRVFDENFLMAIATIGAFALAIYDKERRLQRSHRRHAVLPDRRTLPELRRRQEPQEHFRPHGHPPGLREH